MSVGDAFFPKVLFRALDLKLTASASSDFLEALGKERDLCDEKKKKKPSGQDASVDISTIGLL